MSSIPGLVRSEVVGQHLALPGTEDVYLLYLEVWDDRYVLTFVSDDESLMDSSKSLLGARLRDAGDAEFARAVHVHGGGSPCRLELSLEPTGAPQATPWRLLVNGADTMLRLG